MDWAAFLLGSVVGFLCFALYVGVVFSKLFGEISRIVDAAGKFQAPEADQARAGSGDLGRAQAAYGPQGAFTAVESRPELGNGATVILAANEPFYQGTPIPHFLRKRKCRLCSQIRSFFE